MTQVNAIERYLEILRQPPTRRQLHDLLDWNTKVLQSNLSKKYNESHDIAIDKNTMDAHDAVNMAIGFFGHAVNNATVPNFFSTDHSIGDETVFASLKDLYEEAVAYLLKNFAVGNLDIWYSSETRALLNKYSNRAAKLQTQDPAWNYLTETNN